MSETANPLADLMLARLLMPAKKPPALAAIHKDVAPLIRGGLRKERAAEVLAEFRSAGLLPPKGQALTESGRARALAVLGLSELPPKCNWAKLKAGYLIPRALELKPWADAEVARVSSADKLAARLLRTKYELPIPADTNLSAVLESLVCKLVGFPTCKSFKDLAATAFTRELQADPPLPVNEAAKLAPRLLLGVARAGVDGYRMKVIGGTFEDRVEPQVPIGSNEPDAFAEAVRNAAPTCPTGWSGDDLVLISHLWNHLKDRPEFESLDLASFKEKLLTSNRARLLSLSRADLVQALDPHDVRDSETTYLNAAFHFLKIRKGP